MTSETPVQDKAPKNPVIRSDSGRWGNTWALFWRGIVVTGIVGLGLSLGLWTVLDRTEFVIKLRPTFILGLTALVIIVTTFVTRGGIFRAFFGQRTSLELKQWSRFSWLASSACLLLAGVNAAVVWTLSEESWVYYKLNVQGLLFWVLLLLSAALAAAPAKATKPNTAFNTDAPDRRAG